MIAQRPAWSREPRPRPRQTRAAASRRSPPPSPRPRQQPELHLRTAHGRSNATFGVHAAGLAQTPRIGAMARGTKGGARLNARPQGAVGCVMQPFACRVLWNKSPHLGQGLAWERRGRGALPAGAELRASVHHCRVPCHMSRGQRDRACFAAFWLGLGSAWLGAPAAEALSAFAVRAFAASRSLQTWPTD